MICYRSLSSVFLALHLDAFPSQKLFSRPNLLSTGGQAREGREALGVQERVVHVVDEDLRRARVGASGGEGDGANDLG